MHASRVADDVQLFRKHPLAVKTLDMLCSQKEPIRLHTIATRMGIHKVSACRVMKWLLGTHLVDKCDIRGESYQGFIVNETVKPLVQHLIQAVKGSNTPIGRGSISIVNAVKGEVQTKLEEMGFTISKSAWSPCGLICRATNIQAGVEFMPFPSTLDKLSEIAGKVCTHAQDFPVIVVAFGSGDDKVAKESTMMEKNLKRIGVNLKFMWIAQSILDMTPSTVHGSVVKPLARLVSTTK